MTAWILTVRVSYTFRHATIMWSLMEEVNDTMKTMELDPEIPANSLANATPWLLCWAAISLFIIMPAVHYFAIIISRRLAGYRALPTQRQVDWNQSVTMTIIIATLLAVGFTRAHWICSGSIHSRANCFLPWTRGGVCCTASSISMRAYTRVVGGWMCVMQRPVNTKSILWLYKAVSYLSLYFCSVFYYFSYIWSCFWIGGSFVLR